MTVSIRVEEEKCALTHESCIFSFHPFLRFILASNSLLAAKASLFNVQVMAILCLRWKESR